MRCFLMRDGHIRAVEMLTVGASDEQLIADATRHFRNHVGCDGFEVWDGKRFVYRFPPDIDQAKRRQD